MGTVRGAAMAAASAVREAGNRRRATLRPSDETDRPAAEILARTDPAPPLNWTGGGIHVALDASGRVDFSEGPWSEGRGSSVHLGTPGGLVSLAVKCRLPARAAS